MLTPQLNLLRPSATADSWGRYYTEDWVSKSLVETMQARCPKLIVELGSGRGALAYAASGRWRQAKIVTVDVDYSASQAIGDLDTRKRGSYCHYIHDALDEELASRIDLSLGSVDVAVCNPPYVRPRWRTSFGRILEEAGLSGSLKSIHDAGADLLFIAQNLRLLKRRGKLGLILPDGLVTAEKFEGVRRALLQEHLVEHVVQLPRRAFPGTEAQTYLVVLAKQGGETESVTLRQIGIEGAISPPVCIPADLAQRRLDYSFHISIQQRRTNRRSLKSQSVRDLTLRITRGTFSSQQISLCEWPVFHLSDFTAESSTVPKNFRLSKLTLKKLPQNTKIAVPGDILVARIGRNLQEKVAIVVHGPCVVSDCIFILTPKEKHWEKLFKFLSGDDGRLALAASAHGVGAKFISQSNLMELEIPW